MEEYWAMVLLFVAGMFIGFICGIAVGIFGK